MKYSIHKDCNPAETVEKIKDILKNIKLDVQEQYKRHEENDVTSVRIVIDNTNDVGTNGKGTNEQNALASGYAEFMERLQTNFLVNFRLKEYDEKEIELSELPNFFNSVLLDKLCPKFHELIKIKKQIKQLKFENNAQSDDNDTTTICVPFYSLNESKTKYIPIHELFYLQTTTGISAGNTFEEALVQAISELCERYSMKQVFTKKIHMPTIPKNYYQNIETIQNLVNFIENKGYKITIKDASLGEKKDKSVKIAPPVICTLFEEKDSNGENCQVRFGSHPSLYVAIERTLTEFMQGYQIENQQENDYIQLFRDNIQSSIQDKIGDFYHSVVIFSKRDKNYSFLFSQKKDYDFNEKNWLLTDKNSNKEMLSKLREIGHVYVRNYSFLDFPTVYVFIPELICHRNIDKKFLDNEIKIATLEKEILSGSPLNYSAGELLKICEYGLLAIYEYKLCNIPLTYIAFLCSIILKDNKKIKKFYNRMKVQINYNKKYSGTDYFTNNILLEYYGLLFKHKNDRIVYTKIYKKFVKQIKSKYNLEEYNFDQKAFETLFLDKICIKNVLKLISDNPQNLNKFSNKEDKDRITNIIMNLYKQNEIQYNIL